MRIYLPAVFANSFVGASLGVVRQQVIPEEVAEGTLAACIVGKNHGHALMGDADNVLVYLFAERPKQEGFGPEARVLFAKGYAAGASDLEPDDRIVVQAPRTCLSGHSQRRRRAKRPESLGKVRSDLPGRERASLALGSRNLARFTPSMHIGPRATSLAPSSCPPAPERRKPCSRR